MFNRYGFIVFAFGLAFLADPVWSQDAEDQVGAEVGASTGDTGPAGNQVEPIDYTPAFDRIEAAIRDLIAEEDKAAREREESQQSRDLQAQEEMADWAGKMFWASVASVLLTFFGLLLIGRTLHFSKIAADHTEKMLGEAKRTTEVAVNAAKVAEDGNRQAAALSEMDARAYLSVSNVKIISEDDKVATVSFALRNVGKSLAHNIQAIRFVRCDPGVALDRFEGDIPSGSQEFPLIATLVPGAAESCEVTVFLDQTYDDRLREVEDGTASHVEIMLVYQTVFDRVRRTYSGEVALSLELDWPNFIFNGDYGELAVESFSASFRPSWMNAYLRHMQDTHEQRVFVQTPNV